MAKNRSKVETVVRNVKFDYFEVHILHDQQDRLFNLAQWAATLPAGKTSEKRNVRSFGEIIRCDDCESDQHGGSSYTTLHFTKLREKNTPAVATLSNAELSDVTLGANEYIAEDISILFDETNYVAMIQKNIYSLSVSALQKYLNYFWNLSKDESDNDLIELRPIFERGTIKKARNSKDFKQLSISTADVSEASKFSNPFSGDLGDTIKALRNFDGLQIQIKISVGRHRKTNLNQKEVIDAIDQIKDNQGNFKDAEVKVGDSGKVELIDLINGTFFSVIPFNVPLKTALHPDSVKTAMLGEYLPSSNDMQGNIQKNKK